uniref:DDE Tnp4 domain-containing protein n=1 Tax=Timema tahoe TaxID=61484 RepID=A0A7R9IGD0_9NEOP|nr:unnamed protein product [Timema tahoe]
MAKILCSNIISDLIEVQCNINNSKVLGKRLRYGNKSVSPSVPLEEKLLMTCWMLGNTSSYREASEIFKVSKAVVHHIFHHICNELALLAEKYIRWPTPEECATITDSFENQFGFPGVVGVIGSCSIRVREPPGISENDINGIVLQAVCDDKMLLLDVYTGYPGDTTPAKVLPKSPLYVRLACKNDPLIEPHKHILGNSNYPQLATLLTPYNEEGNQTLSEQELKFNRLHKMACSLIDDSFEILKKRFQRLEYIDVTRVNVANKVIVAACVLHNFAILQGDYYSSLMESGEEVLGSEMAESESTPTYIVCIQISANKCLNKSVNKCTGQLQLYVGSSVHTVDLVLNMSPSEVAGVSTLLT